jgi:uncharacterized protein YhaN
VTDTQWHDLVGLFGIPGLLFLALIAWVLYSRRPKNGKNGDLAKLLEKINDLGAAITAAAEKNRHEYRNILTVTHAEVLDELKSLAQEMRETLGRIERKS